MSVPASPLLDRLSIMTCADVSDLSAWSKIWKDLFLQREFDKADALVDAWRRQFPAQVTFPWGTRTTCFHLMCRPSKSTLPLSDILESFRRLLKVAPAQKAPVVAELVLQNATTMRVSGMLHLVLQEFAHLLSLHSVHRCFIKCCRTNWVVGVRQLCALELPASAFLRQPTSAMPSRHHHDSSSDSSDNADSSDSSDSSAHRHSDSVSGGRNCKHAQRMCSCCPAMDRFKHTCMQHCLNNTSVESGAAIVMSLSPAQGLRVLLDDSCNLGTKFRNSVRQCVLATHDVARRVKQLSGADAARTMTMASHLNSWPLACTLRELCRPMAVESLPNLLALPLAIEAQRADVVRAMLRRIDRHDFKPRLLRRVCSSLLRMWPRRTPLSMDIGIRTTNIFRAVVEWLPPPVPKFVPAWFWNVMCSNLMYHRPVHNTGTQMNVLRLIMEELPPGHAISPALDTVVRWACSPWIAVPVRMALGQVLVHVCSKLSKSDRESWFNSLSGDVPCLRRLGRWCRASSRRMALLRLRLARDVGRVQSLSVCVRVRRVKCSRRQ